MQIMAWVSEDSLNKHIIQQYIAANGSANGLTPQKLAKEVEKYEKRRTRGCGCCSDDECNCVVFGNPNNFDYKYEYFIPAISR